MLNLCTIDIFIRNLETCQPECTLRSISSPIVVLDHHNSLITITIIIMSPPPSNPPTLFTEPVPGGSLIGSVGSQFAAVFTLYQSHHQLHPQLHPAQQPHTQTGPDHSHAPTYTSFNSDLQSPQTQIDAEMDRIIKSLARTKIEGLVTLAWIRRIPQQDEGKLRGLVSSAVRDGLLTCDDIYSTQMNSFARLPTAVRSPSSPA